MGLKAELHRGYESIDRYLTFWPKHLIEKSKHRLNKIINYLGRLHKRNSYISSSSPAIDRRRQKRTIRNANTTITSADIDRTITEELLSRLKSGIYKETFSPLPLKDHQSRDSDKEVM